MTTSPLGVLIVDDEAPARERLARLVGELEDWTVVGECATGLQALEQVARLAPAVVLLERPHARDDGHRGGAPS